MEPEPPKKLLIFTPGYFEQLQNVAKGCCAPLYYRDETGVYHNGSMTFVDTGQAILGVTAGHVADAVLRHCGGRGGHRCQVGNAELDASRLIARHALRDLATFRLSHPFLATAGHYAATLPSWPPPALRINERVLYTGYPGTYRSETKDLLHVPLVWFYALVESASSSGAGTALRIAQSLSPGERVPAHADLGGLSGGAVFRLVEQEVVARLEVAAIIYEYASGYEIVLAHPMACVAEDGTFVE